MRRITSPTILFFPLVLSAHLFQSEVRDSCSSDPHHYLHCSLLLNLHNLFHTPTTLRRPSAISNFTLHPFCFLFHHMYTTFTAILPLCSPLSSCSGVCECGVCVCLMRRTKAPFIFKSPLIHRITSAQNRHIYHVVNVDHVYSVRGCGDSCSNRQPFTRL